MPINEPIHLGDGVYAKYDGYQIYIWTSDGYAKSEPIAIDSKTAQSLIAFIEQCYGGDA